MHLSRHHSKSGVRWARDGELLPVEFSLRTLLELPKAAALESLTGSHVQGPAPVGTLAPIEPEHEVWACGVTYLKSRDARKAESASSSVYDLVYDAERPELFYKAAGWRTVGDGGRVRIRRDSSWNVPEPEMTLLINRSGEILGYTAGNDMSSRDIEGANPLYLPQAKVYEGSCAIGPGLTVFDGDEIQDMPIEIEIERKGSSVFRGATSTAQLKRSPAELVGYLYRELEFPFGAFLMTGTGIVPPEEFTLQDSDEVRIRVGSQRLVNLVQDDRAHSSPA